MSIDLLNFVRGVGGGFILATIVMIIALVVNKSFRFLGVGHIGD